MTQEDTLTWWGWAKVINLGLGSSHPTLGVAAIPNWHVTLLPVWAVTAWCGVITQLNFLGGNPFTETFSWDTLGAAVWEVLWDSAHQQYPLKTPEWFKPGFKPGTLLPKAGNCRSNPRGGGTSTEPPCPWPEAIIEESSSSGHPALSLDHTYLEIIINDIQPDIIEEGVTEASFQPKGIYWIVRSKYKLLKRDHDLVLEVEEDFQVNFSQQWQHFFEVLKRRVAEDVSLADREAVISHNKTKPSSECIPQESQEQAIEYSWTVTFVRQSLLEGLKHCVSDQLSQIHTYGHYCSIVQSSGMGKSCLLNELSEDYFLISINLCLSDSQGYPPADSAMHNFLQVDNGHLLQKDASHRM
ncbi:hypothetical protein EDB85DRAFT_1896567 [Lactarius pseudohatsudake]|nr:hypothetical protein EDB85DRAFT_1896567 [Lactarius pseudohatsudake]